MSFSYRFRCCNQASLRVGGTQRRGLAHPGFRRLHETPKANICYQTFSCRWLRRKGRREETKKEAEETRKKIAVEDDDMPFKGDNPQAVFVPHSSRSHYPATHHLKKTFLTSLLSRYQLTTTSGRREVGRDTTEDEDDFDREMR